MPPWYDPTTNRHLRLEHAESKPWRAFIGARALAPMDLPELSLEQGPELLAHECNLDVGIDILIALLLLFLPLLLGGC